MRQDNIIETPYGDRIRRIVQGVRADFVCTQSPELLGRVLSVRSQVEDRREARRLHDDVRVEGHA